MTYNQYGWNNHSNMIFLDQPINVGYSYSDDGSRVGSSADGAVDVYAFLQLFFMRFPKYQAAPFHIAAESYGGTYGPHIASTIFKRNSEIKSGTFDRVKVNLESLVLANGYTNPYVQTGKMPEYMCSGPYAVFDGLESPECLAYTSKISNCQRLIQACNTFNSRLACVPATLYCGSVQLAPIQGDSIILCCLCTDSCVRNRSPSTSESV